MSKFVVTGGAGFIGSALVRGLLREGASKVVVIDNLLTGHEENLDEVRPDAGPLAEPLQLLERLTWLRQRLAVLVPMHRPILDR